MRKKKINLTRKKIVFFTDIQYFVNFAVYNPVKEFWRTWVTVAAPFVVLALPLTAEPSVEKVNKFTISSNKLALKSKNKKITGTGTCCVYVKLKDRLLTL
jgi:hypothetical protein